jgi:SAM-dependent methyltransferase
MTQFAPLKLGSDEQFARVRAFLRECGYTAENICARLGVERLALFEGLQPRTEGWAQKDALNLLISLFSLGESVEAGEARGLPEEFRTLGLVAEFGNARIFAPVAIGPVEDLFFVSDRWCSADGSKFEIADDAVYPAITPNTLKFLDTVPLQKCDALLDVGAGTGVGALLGAAHYAKRAWAVDITERSAKFAEFNARLNGLANVRSGRGDLYEPVRGETFDRIIAHPPYVPVLSHHWTFHDGGDDGELLTRRLIEGLPEFLRPEGIFHCYAMGSDREQVFEERIRGWLGARHAEFDVQVIVKNTMDPMQFAMQTVLKHEDPNADLAKWKRLFDGYKVKRLVFGPMTIQRHDGKRKAFTARRVASAESTRAEAEWLRQAESALAAVADVLQMRPKLARRLELVVHHPVQDGAFTASGYEVRTQYPFAEEANVPGWAAVFLGRCTGENTVQELLDELKAEKYLKPHVAPEDFAELVGNFIARGFVEVEEMALPERR